MDTLHISIPSCDTKREGVHSQFLMNFLTISNPNQLRVSDAARLLFNLTLREKKSYFHPISSIPTLNIMSRSSALPSIFGPQWSATTILKTLQSQNCNQQKSFKHFSFSKAEKWTENSALDPFCFNTNFNFNMREREKERERLFQTFST